MDVSAYLAYFQERQNRWRFFLGIGALIAFGLLCWWFIARVIGKNFTQGGEFKDENKPHTEGGGYSQWRRVERCAANYRHQYLAKPQISCWPTACQKSKKLRLYVYGCRQGEWTVRPIQKTAWPEWVGTKNNSGVLQQCLWLFVRSRERDDLRLRMVLASRKHDAKECAQSFITTRIWFITRKKWQQK